MENIISVKGCFIMKNKRKLVTLIISYTAAAFAVIIGIACLNHAKAENYQRQIENTKQHAFRELSEALNQMDASLKKSVYATSPSMVTYM